MSRVAMCRSCENEPLVSTFDFYKKEFICLSCGQLFEWLQPRGEEETTELLELVEARRAQWEELSVGHLPRGMRRTACEQCSVGGDYDHYGHATPEEIAAHEAAVARIDELRAGAAAA